MAGPLPQNFVSQGKIFIDMPGPRGAAKQLLTCKKFDAKPQGSREVITTIGVNDGAGTRKKQGGHVLTMTFVRTVGQEPEVDWDFANQTDKFFTISTEDELNGRKQSWLFCQVSKTDTTKNPEGEHEDEVEVVALQKVDDQ